MTDLTEPQRAFLEALSEESGPAFPFDTLEKANPQPAVKDGRRREHKRWTERQVELLYASLELDDKGLIYQAQDGPCLFALTLRGRTALLEAARLAGGDGAQKAS